MIDQNRFTSDRRFLKLFCNCGSWETQKKLCYAEIFSNWKNTDS